jgi:hypothetical protein
MLKIRCSALGKIIHFDPATVITESQLSEIAALELRKVTPVALTDNQLVELGKLGVQRATEKGLTEAQKKKFDALIAKRDNPQGLTETQQNTLDALISKRDTPTRLSGGAKTYIEDVFYGEKFDFIKSFTSKYTEKGNAQEERAIEQIIDFLGLPMAFKNEQWFENDFIHGTMDVLMKSINLQFDVKCPYFPNALGVFTDKLDHDYEWQQHGYNWLAEVDNAAVIRILMNPPENILEKEAWTRLKDAGLSQMTDEFMNDVRELFNFEGKQPVEDRIRIYTLQTTQEHIETIKTAVTLAREYWDELEEKWKAKNTNEIETIRSLFVAA